MGRNQELIKEFIESGDDRLCIDFGSREEAIAKMTALWTIRKKRCDTDYNVHISGTRVILVREGCLLY